MSNKNFYTVFFSRFTQYKSFKIQKTNKSRNRTKFAKAKMQKCCISRVYEFLAQFYSLGEKRAVRIFMIFSSVRLFCIGEIYTGNPGLFRRIPFAEGG